MTWEISGSHTAHAEEGISLRIASYSILPVVGMPAILARCINTRTSHSCHCLWGYDGYGNGTEFAGDINWRKSPVEAEAVLKEADMVLVHNGRVDPRHQSLLKGKAVVMVAHNELKLTDQSLVKQGFPGAVVGQYQATLPEFKGWAVVPQPIPLWEQAYQPGEKAGTIAICYTPSIKHEHYPPDHYLYWHSKGYTETMQVLAKLATQFPIQLEVIRNHQLPHRVVLAMKRRAHIVLDECITGSYHRNSLEGLAAGCVVVNGVGLLSGVIEVLRYCAGGESSNPFVFASLETLEGVLTSLIERGVTSLVEEGRENRLWIEQHWDFGKQWERFWMPAINQALCHASNIGSAKLVPAYRS